MSGRSSSSGGCSGSSVSLGPSRWTGKEGGHSSPPPPPWSAEQVPWPRCRRQLAAEAPFPFWARLRAKIARRKADKRAAAASLAPAGSDPSLDLGVAARAAGLGPSSSSRSLSTFGAVLGGRPLPSDAAEDSSSRGILSSWHRLGATYLSSSRAGSQGSLTGLQGRSGQGPVKRTGTMPSAALAAGDEVVAMEPQDVGEERDRVRELARRRKEGNTAADNVAVLVDGLGKVFKASANESGGGPHPLLSDCPGRGSAPQGPAGPKEAVKSVSLAIHGSECFGLLGPNGAGKTTTLRMITGFYQATSGSVEIAGLSVPRDMSKVYQLMGVCPQHDLLWPQLTGREHLLFYGRLKGLGGRALVQAAVEGLRSVNLLAGGAADNLVKTYSGGMKRR